MTVTATLTVVKDVPRSTTNLPAPDLREVRLFGTTDNEHWTFNGQPTSARPAGTRKGLRLHCWLLQRATNQPAPDLWVS